MKRESKDFRRTCLLDDPVEYKLNKFLSEHPNYDVLKRYYNNVPGTCLETLSVVFVIKEETDE